MPRSGGNPHPVSVSSDILQRGYQGNVTTLRSLQLINGYTLEHAAQATLVSPETFRRWRSDRRPNPTAVRLLAILGGYVPWPGWHGWEVHSGLLFPPGYTRHGIAPGQILALPYLQQALAGFRRDSEPETLPESPVFRKRG